MNQVTIIKERARESLIAKGFLGDTLNYYEAMQLCHNGYHIHLKEIHQSYFWLRSGMIDGRYALWANHEDGSVIEYVTDHKHILMDWEVKK